MYGWGTYAVFCDLIGQPDHYKPDAVCLAVCFHFCDVSLVLLVWGGGVKGRGVGYIPSIHTFYFLMRILLWSIGLGKENSKIVKEVLETKYIVTIRLL